MIRRKKQLSQDESLELFELDQWYAEAWDLRQVCLRISSFLILRFRLRRRLVNWTKRQLMKTILKGQEFRSTKASSHLRTFFYNPLSVCFSSFPIKGKREKEREMCVCVREICMCVCVCVCEREREMCVCVCVCVREKDVWE